MDQNKAYAHLREEAQNISDLQKERQHPCVAGNGECCAGDAEAIEQDIEFLLAGFRDGVLPIEILHDAVERAQQQSSRCPFLNDQNLCTVYEKRPLICIVNNGLYIPVNERRAKNISNMGSNNRKEAKVPYNWLGNKMCKACHEACKKLPDGHPLKNINVDQVFQSEGFIRRVYMLAEKRGEDSIHFVSDVPLIIARLLGERV